MNKEIIKNLMFNRTCKNCNYNTKKDCRKLLFKGFTNRYKSTVMNRIKYKTCENWSDSIYIIK